MHIRRAAVEDIPALIAISVESETAAHWTEAQFRNALTGAHPRRTVLVLVEGRVLGFVAAAEIAGEWELENIVVSAAERRKGFAEQLMTALLEEIRHSGAKVVHLEVRVSNLSARKLYEKWGFEQVGTRSKYYHTPVEDAVLYRKNLSSAAPENG